MNHRIHNWYTANLKPVRVHYRASTDQFTGDNFGIFQFKQVHGTNQALKTAQQLRSQGYVILQEVVSLQEETAQ